MSLEKIKIALVSNTSWSLYNFRIEVIRSLIAEGMEIYLLAPEDAYSSKLIAEGAIFVPIRMNNYSINPFGDLLLCFQFWRLYNKYRFDHIFHYTIKPNVYGSLAAWISSTKCTVVTTGLGRSFKFRNPMLNWFSVILYRLAALCSVEVWFLNKEDQKLFIRKKIISPDKSFILPSEGVNMQKFKPFKKKRKSHITRFLFAGRLLKEKGIYEFAEAARLLRAHNKKLRFEILGFVDEKNSNSIKRHEITAWQKEGNVKYLGSTEDVRPYIDRSDCIVFPSYYQEGISRILLEAASMETPIITTNNTGCKEVVIDRVNGLICRDKSVESLLEKIMTFCAIPENIQRSMGEKGRVLVRDKFDVDNVIQIYKSKIKEYLGIFDDSESLSYTDDGKLFNVK